MKRQWQLFFFQWKRLFQRNPSFWLAETDFLASGNRFCLFFFFFVQRFFLLVETVTEISGNQFQKKEYILTTVSDFLASETIFFHYLRQQSTAASGPSLFFICNIFFSQSFIPWKQVFCLLETVLFYSEFFVLVKTIIDTWGKSIFKDKIYFCQ